LALLAAHGRHRQADHLAVVAGRQAQVAGADGLLDVLEHALVVRPDDDLLRLGDADLGQLLEGGGRAVVLDAQAVHQGGRGPAGAQAAQLVAEDVDRLLQALFGVQEDLVASHGRNRVRVRGRCWVWDTPSMQDTPGPPSWEAATPSSPLAPASGARGR